MSRQRVSNQEIIEAYERTRSVWKAAKELGVVGQSVHERLVALEYPMNGGGRRWTDEEDREMADLLDAGLTVTQVAARLGRTFNAVAIRMSRAGIKARPKATTNKPARGAGYDKVNLNRLMKTLEGNPKLKPTTLCRQQGLDIETFVNAVQRWWPERWDAWVEVHSPLPTKVCPYCEVVFRPMTGKQIYCSRKCGNDARADASYFGGKRRSTIGLAEGVCQMCGRQVKRGMSSHHILGKENDPNNEFLVALCQGCHNIVTKIGGRTFMKPDDFEAQASMEAMIWLGVIRRLGVDAIDKVVEVFVEVSVRDPYDEELEEPGD